MVTKERVIQVGDYSGLIKLGPEYTHAMIGKRRFERVVYGCDLGGWVESGCVDLINTRISSNSVVADGSTLYNCLVINSIVDSAMVGRPEGGRIQIRDSVLVKGTVIVADSHTELSIHYGGTPNGVKIRTVNTTK